MNECDCDRSGRYGFCMHDCQAAFDALDELKRRYPEGTAVIARLGFYPESLVGAVGTIIHDVQAVASELRQLDRRGMSRSQRGRSN